MDCPPSSRVSTVEGRSHVGKHFLHALVCLDFEILTKWSTHFLAFRRDEPAIKAKFDLTLVAPKDRVALSNMPIVEEHEDPADKTKRIVKFATSPIMSTYLVCYVIGEYEHVEQHTKRGVPVRVYTAVGKTERGQFALETAVRCLDFFEEYFKIEYPLPKLDLIAIADFPAGAMVSARCFASFHN